MAKITTAQLNERWEIGVAIGIIVLILLLAYLNGAMQPSVPPLPSLQNPSGVDQPNIWQPATTLPNINVNVPPANQYNVGNGVTCGCGCNNSAIGAFGCFEWWYRPSRRPSGPLMMISGIVTDQHQKPRLALGLFPLKKSYLTR